MLPEEFKKSIELCDLNGLLKSKCRFVVDGNKVIDQEKVEGVEVKSEEVENGINVELKIKKGVKLTEPIFLCFGVMGSHGEQIIIPNIIFEEGAEANVVSHCTFPKAIDVSHEMEAQFKIGKNAKMNYTEYHYHGNDSGARVVPKLNVDIAEGGTFVTSFNLSKGTIGKTSIELEVHLAKNARTEIETKVLGKNEKDHIEIIDKVYLEGENSKSLIKMRAAAQNGGIVLMQGETYAKAAGCIGHVDCQEILSGKNSVARAVPIVEVSNDEARVTHEASVGKINQKELETLMTRGLDEEEASELIINSLLR
ncbi:MAG: SufD family Fe-S cluster assembly protein [Patescibacteria group bacterium]|jgi:Fe-S cluster assembly scaffold protein SufB|nr:SufD family Fe-S cluster assembly protein [Patescibacteria group bacterium]